VAVRAFLERELEQAVAAIDTQDARRPAT
jgi:hypothetical protein